ncbi:hypothetical protein OIU93_03940 [Paeniglutamicibacter sp. ZC-3]|uniref:hypothetical protein n=1 Tax=Paeniglutamicibacter sp. ZC-3 TaxID=2986919 RepID=UPI0021F7E4FA|nr:hypothetical protein [Paeniglutamicibacter sp. ZC-3]MCV9993447.1 hypothetical protein [Paeniglutamicibacter sp. ZC-3]
MTNIIFLSSLNAMPCALGLPESERFFQKERRSITTFRVKNLGNMVGWRIAWQLFRGPANLLCELVKDASSDPISGLRIAGLGDFFGWIQSLPPQQLAWL